MTTFAFRGKYSPTQLRPDRDDLFWQFPRPAQPVDKSAWQPCHACAAVIPVVHDAHIVRPRGTVEPTGTISYVCPHCRATQVGTEPDHQLFDPQHSCHECAHELGDALACPSCGMPRYWVSVTCPRCGSQQAVVAPHLANSCDLFTLQCVSCETQYVSLCIC